MRIKVYDDEEQEYFVIENVGMVKPYKEFYGDRAFMILFNGHEKWSEYSRDRYEIDKIMGDKIKHLR